MCSQALDRQLPDTMEQASGERLSDTDRERVGRALADALAPATQRAYLGHWNAFAAWAVRGGYASLPAGPLTVAAHLTVLADKASVSTLRVRRAAIAAVHRAKGLLDPTAHELVRKTLAGLVRRPDRPPRQARPLSDSDLAAIRATALQPRVVVGKQRTRRESAAAARQRGLVDIALCSVMRDGLLRREEAAALTWADITEDADGSGRLSIRRSKTDPEARGCVLFLGPQAMLDLAAIRSPDTQPDDRVFPIGGAQINRRIQAAAKAAGLQPGFSGHSARVGMAQDLAADGASLTELMQVGRWKSSSMPALYTRSQAAGRNAVAKYHAKRSKPGA